MNLNAWNSACSYVLRSVLLLFDTNRANERCIIWSNPFDIKSLHVAGFLCVIYAILNASVILERNETRLARNKKCLKRNKTHLARNEARDGNLLLSGTVDERKRDQFHRAIRHFYEQAALEAISKLPLQDDILICARFVDFFQRENASVEDVECFLKNSPTVLPTTARETHLLQEECVEYQLLRNEDIPK